MSIEFVNLILIVYNFEDVINQLKWQIQLKMSGCNHEMCHRTIHNIHDSDSPKTDIN